MKLKKSDHSKTVSRVWLLSLFSSFFLSAFFVWDGERRGGEEFSFRKMRFRTEVSGAERKRERHREEY